MSCFTLFYFFVDTSTYGIPGLLPFDQSYLFINLTHTTSCINRRYDLFYASKTFYLSKVGDVFVYKLSMFLQSLNKIPFFCTDWAITWLLNFLF